MSKATKHIQRTT